MVSGRRVDDDGSMITDAFHSADAESVSLQAFSRLRGTQIDIEAIAFDLVHATCYLPRNPDEISCVERLLTAVERLLVKRR